MLNKQQNNLLIIKLPQLSDPIVIHNHNSACTKSGSIRHKTINTGFDDKVENQGRTSPKEKQLCR